METGFPVVKRADGWECKNSLLRLFQVNIRLGQASILAEADAPVLFSRAVKVFLFLRKQNFVFSGFAFWPFPSFF